MDKIDSQKLNALGRALLNANERRFIDDLVQDVWLILCIRQKEKKEINQQIANQIFRNLVVNLRRGRPINKCRYIDKREVLTGDIDKMEGKNND